MIKPFPSASTQWPYFHPFRNVLSKQDLPNVCYTPWSCYSLWSASLSPTSRLHATDAREQLQPGTQLPAPSAQDRQACYSQAWISTHEGSTFSLENSATFYSKPRLSIKSVTTMTFLAVVCGTMERWHELHQGSNRGE